MSFRCQQLSVAMMLLSASATTAQQNQGAQELVQQILQSWSRAEQSVSACRVKITDEYWVARDGPLTKRSVNTSAWSIAQNRYSYENYSAEGSQFRVSDIEKEISNELYSAKMRMNRITNQWVLVSHKPISLDYSSFRRSIVLPWTRLPNFQITEWLQDPHVVFGMVERIGPSIARLHFTREPGGHPSSDLYHSGYFEFDTSRSYIVTGYKCLKRSKNSTTLETCACEYLPLYEYSRAREGGV